MPAPLAPAVIGPVYAVPNAQIQVDNVLPDAKVQVFQNGSPVGHATSTTAGLIWVPTTVALTVGDQITATQTYTGGASYVHVTVGVASPASPNPVTVAAVPKLLPTPVFQSLVNQCSSAVWLGSLIPGTTVTIDQGGPSLGGGLVQFPTQWFTLTGAEPTPGKPLQAVQAFGSDKSPIGFSANVAPEVMSLPTPKVATPLRDCQTFLDLSDMVPGGTVEVTNNGVTDTGTSPAASYRANLQPLVTGPLTVQQYFSRCEKVPHSGKANENVVKVSLPTPIVGYALCPSVSQLTVSNLLPGEVLTVTAVVPQTNGLSTTVLGSQGVSSATATVYLPPLPAGTAAVRLSVTLCGVENEKAPGFITVPVSTATLPIGPPDLRTPLFDCASEVVVTNAHPGSLLTVFSGAATNVLANPVVAAADVVTIGLMTPLVTGQHVQVLQTGCNANGQSPVHTVQKLPSPIPAPVIQTPVLSDATSITVSDILPGAQLVLYIGGVAAVQVIALDKTWSIPVAANALKNAKFIQVSQELCGHTSALTDKTRATVEAPAPLPSGGLLGNSGYFFQNSCNNLTGVTIEIDITEELGGSGSSYIGFSFQLNCWSGGVTDVNAWQQFFITFDGISTISAFSNSWPFNWDGSASDDTINNSQTLATTSTSNLPPDYKFSIKLTNASPGGQVTAVTFGGSDNNGNAFTPVVMQMVGQTDQQGGTINSGQLAPIVAFQLLLVGPINGLPTKLTTGAGKMTISANGTFIASGSLPTGGCWAFDAPGTAEDSNATYSELPAAASQKFVQFFSV